MRLHCPSFSMHTCFLSTVILTSYCIALYSLCTLVLTVILKDYCIALDFLCTLVLTVILKSCCVALHSLCTLVLKVILQLLMLIYKCILINNLSQDFQHYVSLHLKSTIPRQYVVVLTPANIDYLIL